MGRWIALIATACVLSSHVALGQPPGDPASPQREMVTRPDPEGTPTEVSVGLYFLDVSQIDDVAQEFAADVVIRNGSCGRVQRAVRCVGGVARHTKGDPERSPLELRQAANEE